MSIKMQENDGSKIPFLKAWLITLWSLVPLVLALLLIASFGPVVVLAYFGGPISGLLMVVVAGCLMCGFIFGFLFEWYQAIEAKRPLADTPITKGIVLIAAGEAYNKMKARILRRTPKEA